MDRQLFKINFPQQAVQLLFVPPVPVQDERDDADDQKEHSCDACSDFTGVACQRHVYYPFVSRVE